MPLYLCRWPNGDLSIVYASDEEDAAMRLEEVGDAEDPGAILVPFPEFAMHFKLPEKIGEKTDLDTLLPPFEFEHFGEEMQDFLSKQFYPEFYTAAMKIDFDDKEAPTSPKQAIEELNEALSAEKERLWPKDDSSRPHRAPGRVM